MANVQNTASTKLTQDSSQVQQDNKNLSNSAEQAASAQEQLDARIKILQGSVGVLGGAIEGTVGALALSSSVSKEAAEGFQNAAVGAIAFADGASRTLTGIKDLSEGLTTAAKNSKTAAAAQRILGKAIKFATGPIGIFLTIAGALGAALFALRDKIEVVGKAFSFFGKIFNKIVEAVGLGATEQEKYAAAQGEASKETERQLKLAQAQGQSTEDLIKLERKLLEEKRNAIKEGTEEYINAQNDLDVFNAKVEDEADAKREEQKQKDREALQARNDLYKSELQKLQDTGASLQAQTDEQRLALAYQNQLREIDQLKISQKQKDELRLQAEANYNTQLGALQDKQNEEALKKQEAAAQTNASRRLELLALEATTLQEQRDAEIAALEAQYQKEYDLAVENGEDITALNKLYSEKAKQINEDTNEAIAAQDKAAAKVKADIINATIDNFQGALTALFQESKGVARANVLIDAAQAAVGIVKSAQDFKDPTGTLAILYQISQFALLAATTASSLRQINQAEPGGGGSSSTPKGGGLSIPRGITSGAFIGSTTTPPTTGTGEPPIRAYVVTGDVTNGQIAESQIRRRRSLGK